MESPLGACAATFHNVGDRYGLLEVYNSDYFSGRQQAGTGLVWAVTEGAGWKAHPAFFARTGFSKAAPAGLAPAGALSVDLATLDAHQRRAAVTQNRAGDRAPGGRA